MEELNAGDVDVFVGVVDETEDGPQDIGLDDVGDVLLAYHLH